MEISAYEPLYGMKLRLTEEKKDKVCRKMKEVVTDLHAGGFVHGDLRDTNILVDCESLTKESDDVEKVQ
jgi:tRNA A-37 threonylcarbamoyl transferase component Bud32